MSQKYELFTNEEIAKNKSRINGNASSNTNGKLPNHKFDPSTPSTSTSASPIEMSQEEMMNTQRFENGENAPSIKNKSRHRIRLLVENIYFRLFGLFLILIDCSLLIIDLSLNKTENQRNIFNLVSLVFITYFLIEVCLRIYAVNTEQFFSNFMDTLDFSIIIVSFFVTIIYSFVNLSGFTRLVLFGRLIRMSILVKIFYTEPRNLQKATRIAVSENKRRFRTSLFDLDLTYITEKVVAMSFPSSGCMAIYRNNIKDVARFLDVHHGPDNYRVYNLCAEKHYDIKWFHGNVSRVPIDDHNVPSLSQILEFCKDVEHWFKINDKHIIAIHCLGGKGRTGTLICSWLVYSGQFNTSQESLEYFAQRRTDKSVSKKFQGVETPSQSRYVEYFTKIVQEINCELPAIKTIQLKSFKIYSLNGIGRGNGSDLTMTIYINRNHIFNVDFENEINCKVNYNPLNDTLFVEPVNCPELIGDVRFKFNCKSKSVPKGYEECAFYFWFNTSFINSNCFRLERSDIDNPHKKKYHNIYRQQFAIELQFDFDNINQHEISSSV